MAFKAIIFDMDGLLVDSETVWHVAEREMIESRGHVYSEEARSQIIGLRMDEFMTKLHEIYSFTETVDELIDELVGRMLDWIPDKVKAQPGAREIVQYVAEHKIPTAIASSSPMSIIDCVIESQGWGGVFKKRLSADDDVRGKPAPDVYLRAARELGFDPADCLALEDSPNGARAAVSAGLTCYCVPDTSHSKVEAFNAITPYVFGSLFEALETIQS
jgi:HAD superfamily hydrolase (TIGR01509 family)